MSALVKFRSEPIIHPNTATEETKPDNVIDFLEASLQEEFAATIDYLASLQEQNRALELRVRRLEREVLIKETLLRNSLVREREFRAQVV
jgi:hypothetical protein